MRIFVLIPLIACAVAAPTGDVPTEEVKPEPVPILKQINQLNDDGSYTFGFESGDGSFRVETRDINGHIRGKYGYIDENGERQVLEYVSGKDSGKALGFQPSGVLSPFPVLRAVQSPEQLVLDYQYSSVDLDEDGIPDAAPAARAGYEPKAAYPEAKAAYPEAKAAYPEAKAAYPEAKAAYPEAKSDYPTKTEYASPEPAVVTVVEVAADPAPVVPVAPAPEPVRVVLPEPVQIVVPQPVQETVQVIHAPAPLPVPVVRAPVPVQFAPAPLHFAPAPIQFAQQPFPQQLFRVSAVQQRQPTVVDQQFLEDLQNQSVDADEDGQPDQAVQIVQGPSVQLIQSPVPLFGSRII